MPTAECFGFWKDEKIFLLTKTSRQFWGSTSILFQRAMMDRRSRQRHLMPGLRIRGAALHLRELLYFFLRFTDRASQYIYLSIYLNGCTKFVLQ